MNITLTTYDALVMLGPCYLLIALVGLGIHFKR